MLVSKVADLKKAGGREIGDAYLFLKNDSKFS
jgi:hypothetical protein